MHLDIIVTLAVAVFGSTGFWTWVQSRNKQKSAEDRLLLGLAYDKIVWQCNKFIAQGHISAQEFNELDRYMFTPYRELGGNGTAAKLMDEVRKLPTREEE